MKKLAFYIILTVLIVSCKENTKETISADSPEKTAKQSDGLTLLKGDFLYLADAAVLQTHREVYGVIIDEKMEELNEQAKLLKDTEFDWVEVEIRGEITQKPEKEEGWDNRVAIKEILNVTKGENNTNDIIKIENQDAENK